jgi:hypothetical protein
MRSFAEVEELSTFVQDALGAQFHAVGVDRLCGGSKKGVYRVHVDGPRTASVIVYSWADSENFWPDAGGVDTADPFAPAWGLTLARPGLDPHRLDLYMLAPAGS